MYIAVIMIIKQNNASPLRMLVSLKQHLGIFPWWGCHSQGGASDNNNNDYF